MQDRGRWLHCDMVEAGLKLIVEFDGSYWHRGRDAHDKRKATRLRNSGWTVVRLREAPLEPLHADDVQIPKLPTRERPTAAGRIGREHVLQVLYKAVCAGTVTLAAAQKAITTDWTTAGQIVH
ncbi:DUF559 domain-containing protein [Actinoallomurus acanthiterrae]